MYVKVVVVENFGNLARVGLACFVEFDFSTGRAFLPAPVDLFAARFLEFVVTLGRCSFGIYGERVSVSLSNGVGQQKYLRRRARSGVSVSACVPVSNILFRRIRTSNRDTIAIV